MHFRDFVLDFRHSVLTRNRRKNSDNKSISKRVRVYLLSIQAIVRSTLSPPPCAAAAAAQPYDYPGGVNTPEGQEKGCLVTVEFTRSVI